MRTHIGRYFGLALPLFLCGTLAAQPVRCSQDTVTGTYALVTQGTMLMPVTAGGDLSAVPATALALVSIDSTGAISGPGVMSIGGNIMRGPWPGTIRVNSDCSAAVDWTGGTSGDAVILDEGAEIRSVMTHAGNGKGIVLGQWKRISRVPETLEPAQCAATSVHGVYAASYQGIQIGTPPGGGQAMAMPTVMVGLTSIDYQGQISGWGTLSLAGDALRFQITSGKIEVSPDCSAVTRMALTAGPLANDGKGWMVVLDGGNELWSLPTEVTQGKQIAFGTWKRVSPIPLANP